MPQSHYSELINPTKYNTLMSNQHRYISTSDSFLYTFLYEVIIQKDFNTVIELGAGPMRITQQILSTIVDSDADFKFSILDCDQNYINYSQHRIDRLHLPITIIDSPAEEISYKGGVDVFVSQGFHHHVEPIYLKNVYDSLNPGGYYIISDEFLSGYEGELERKSIAILWYMHIISNALTSGYTQLAREEIKTLLDDICENKAINPKSNEIIDQLMSVASRYTATDPDLLVQEVKSLLGTVYAIDQTDPQMYLSRGDHKISNSVFEVQISQARFIIKKQISVGKCQYGNLTVYLLQKSDE
jgi:hypothetical protein